MTGKVRDHPTIQTSARQAAAPLAVLRQAILMISLPFGILNFVLPVYGKEIGAGALQIGLFFSAFSLMTVLLRPVIGASLDRYGRRPFFLAGLAGYAVTMFAFALSAQVWAIVVARTLQGVASAFLWLAANAVTADVAGDDQRGRAFGGVDQAGNQGATLGTFIGFGVLMSLGFGTGWRLLFAGYGAVSLAALLLTWRRLPETHPLARPHCGQSPTAPHRPIAWSRPWFLLLLVTTVTAASATMISPILMIFLQERFAVEPETLAYAFLPYALVGALLPARLGRLADRFGRKPLMVLGLAVAAVTSFFVPYLGSLVALAALWALQALCYVAGDPAERALVADLTGGDQRGRAYGLYALAGGLGATVGPLVGGWLYQAVGPAAPFIANGIVLAACAVVLGILLQVPARANGST
jgi:MFS family permease